MTFETQIEELNKTMKRIAETLERMAPNGKSAEAEEEAAKNILELIAHNRKCIDEFSSNLDAMLSLPVSKVANAIMFLCSIDVEAFFRDGVDRIRDSALYDDPGVREAIDAHAEYAENDEFCLVLLRNAMDALMKASLKRKIAKLQKDFMEMQGADRERVSAELSTLMEKYRELKGEE